MSSGLHATVWTAVGDFVYALLRPKKMRDGWERAFQPTAIFKRTLVIFGGYTLISWGRRRAAETQTSGASCRARPRS